MKKYSPEWFLHHAKKNKVSLWVVDHRELYLLAMTNSSRRPFGSDLPYRINHWEDFEYFEETESWHDKDVFLKDMEERRHGGENCATLVLGNQLAFVELFSIDSNYSFFTDVDAGIFLPPFTTTAYSAYVHPQHRGKGLFAKGIKFISNYLFEETNSQLLVSAVNCENRAALRGHLAAGFHSVAQLKKDCHFGNVVTSVTAIHPDYRLRVSEHEPSCWRLEQIQ